MRGKADFVLCGCVERNRKCCFVEGARVRVWEEDEETEGKNEPKKN